MARERAQEVATEGTVNTIVGKGSTLDGTFNIDNSIRVDGVLKGQLEVSDTLIVGPTGEVEAKSIKVKDAVIGGKVVGTLEASNRAYLESKSVFLGDIQTKLLVIEEGATFKGKCSAGEDTEDVRRLESNLQDTGEAEEQDEVKQAV